MWYDDGEPSVQPHSDVQIGDKVNSWLDSIPVSWRRLQCMRAHNRSVWQPPERQYLGELGSTASQSSRGARQAWPFSSCQKHMTGVPLW
jgi:hypothetical protein